MPTITSPTTSSRPSRPELQAYQSQVLVSVPQERVVVSEELIEIEPADPNVVFVQYYNPWTVFETLVAAYPGYVVEPAPSGVVVADGVSFDPAVSVGLDAHFGFSFGGWTPGWDNGAVAYNNNVYNSNSRSVANRGHFGDRNCRAFEHGGRGVPVGFHPGSHRGFDGRGFGGRGPMARPMPSRISSSSPSTHGRQGLGGRSTPVSRSFNGSRPSTRNFSGAHSTPVNHTMPSRTSTANRFNGANRSAVHSTPGAHANTPSRNTMANHSAPASHSIGGNRGMNQSASANRSLGSNRAMSHSAPTSRPMSRPASATNNSAGNRFAAPSNSFGANRPMSRPTANSFGTGPAMNRPAAANNSFGANRPAARPAAMNRPVGGGGFGGGHKR